MSAVKMNWREFMNFDSPNKYIYIYICMHTSAVKISSLTHAMNFSSLMAIKIFNGGYLAGLGLASPFTTTAFVSFLDKKCVYLDAQMSLWPHQMGDYSDAHSTSPGLSQHERENDTGDEELQQNNTELQSVCQ